VRGTGVPITIVGQQVIRGVGRPEARWSAIDGALREAGYFATMLQPSSPAHPPDPGAQTPRAP
jgi:hypothetical protein